MPSASFSRSRRSSTALPYSAACFFDSPHSVAHLGLFGQVGDDVGIGLQPAQDVGPHQLPQAAEGLSILLLVQSLDKLLELGGRARAGRAAKIEDRPQVAEMVLDGRAR